MINIDKLRRLLDTWSDDARTQAFGDGSTRDYFDGQIAACGRIRYSIRMLERDIVNMIRHVPVSQWITDEAPKAFVDGAQSIMDLLKAEIEAAEHGRGLVAA